MVQKFKLIAEHLIYYFIFLLILTNLGFFFGLALSKWHLPVSLILYLLLLVGLKAKYHLKIALNDVLLVFLTLVFLSIAGFALSKTFDTSYDGQLYHQTAVISLSNGWNPIWNRDLPIIAPTGQYGEDGEFGKHFAIGYPKSLWEIQSAIHLFSGQLQTAAVTNLIVGLIAFIFLLSFLLDLKIKPIWATTVSLIAVLEPHYILEFTSFMQDGFSYQISLVAIVSLLTFMMKNKNSAFIMFCSSWLFLIGTKFSNLPLAATLIFICLGFLVISGLLQNKNIQRLIGAFFIIGTILFASPYVVNFINYGSPVYPANLKWASEDVKYQQTPINLIGKSQGELLLYGIFSKPQISTATSDPANIAHLKLPFTFTKSELIQPQSERVGTGGIFFSGLFVLSLIFLIISLFRKQPAENYKILITILSAVILIIFCALTLSVPNDLRFTPLICFIPTLALIGILKMNLEKPLKWLKALTLIFAILITINISSVLIPTVNARINEFAEIEEQMQTMKNSETTYQVYALNFYSSYLRLEESGVKFVKIAEIGCTQPELLAGSFSSTSFCPPENR